MPMLQAVSALLCSTNRLKRVKYTGQAAESKLDSASDHNLINGPVQAELSI